MAVVAALQPDLYVALCDEVQADAKPKRVTKATARTVKVSPPPPPAVATRRPVLSSLWGAARNGVCACVLQHARLARMTHTPSAPQWRRSLAGTSPHGCQRKRLSRNIDKRQEWLGESHSKHTRRLRVCPTEVRAPRTSHSGAVQWLDACLDLHASRKLADACSVLAPVGGASSTCERSKAAQAVAGKPVAGGCPGGGGQGGRLRGAELLWREGGSFQLDGLGTGYDTMTACGLAGWYGWSLQGLGPRAATPSTSPACPCLPRVAGFALSGFFTGEAPGAERSALLAAAVEHLPADKLRYMPGMVSALPIPLLVQPPGAPAPLCCPAHANNRGGAHNFAQRCEHPPPTPAPANR